MPIDPALSQSDYQVRLDWGLGGLRRLAPAHVVVIVQPLGLTAHALAAVENAAGLDVSTDDDEAAALARAAHETGAHVVAGGLRNAAAVAAHVLEVQRARAERTSISILAAGATDLEGPRFAVEDLLGAGAVVAALGDLGIDHASPDAAVAGRAFVPSAGRCATFSPRVAADARSPPTGAARPSSPRPRATRHPWFRCCATGCSSRPERPEGVSATV